jgi:hypothetical protein
MMVALVTVPPEVIEPGTELGHKELVETTKGS